MTENNKQIQEVGLQKKKIVAVVCFFKAAGKNQALWEGGERLHSHTITDRFQQMTEKP